MLRLVFTVDSAGKVALTVEGVPGPACHTLTREAEELLGPATHRERMREYYQQARAPVSRADPVQLTAMFDAFTLWPDGTVIGLYTDAIDLRALGHVRAERASAVHWDKVAQAWRAQILATGEALGPFRRRDQAVDAERRVLAARLHALAPAPEGMA